MSFTKLLRGVLTVSIIMMGLVGCTKCNDNGRTAFCLTILNTVDESHIGECLDKLAGKCSENELNAFLAYRICKKESASASDEAKCKSQHKISDGCALAVVGIFTDYAQRILESLPSDLKDSH